MREEKVTCGWGGELWTRGERVNYGQEERHDLWMGDEL